MEKLFLLFLIFLFCAGFNFFNHTAKAQNTNSDPLPSWFEGEGKQSIINFITKTTTPESNDFIPLADRIACFDNDGTLWSEQPVYFQFLFAFDRIKELAPQHPEWETVEPFKSVIKNDMKGVMASGEKGIAEILIAVSSGISTEDYDKAVKNWIATAVHPKSGKHYNEMIYRPMLELLIYLRANGYKTFVVSGGGVDFMRVWIEETYGIPPYQVIGSSGKVKYEVIEGEPFLTKLPELNFFDEKEGKPVGIHQYIGKRPVFAAGNSDGDYEMLQWTTTAKGYPRFGMIIHHTDSDREWSYDRNSHIGKLEKGLDDAAEYGWVIIDMKKDWKKIFPFE